MLRVLVCVALLLSGCAFDEPAPRYQVANVPRTRAAPSDSAKTENRTEKIPVACPTDGQIRAIAVEASRATYLHPSRPKGGGSGSCPCRRDEYKTKDGVLHSCKGESAEDRKNWVMCHPETVPRELVEKIKGDLPAECRR